MKHFVEIHGGNIRVESPGKDKGSTFTVEIPIRVSQGHPRAPKITPSKGLDIEIPKLSILEGVTILLIEDDADTRALIERILKKFGATLMSADSVIHALEILNKSRPDVIVSDIGLPDEDGISFILKLRAKEKESGDFIPAVALTAYTGNEERDRALQSGFQIHVPKPIDSNLLITSIARLAHKLNPVGL